MNDLFYNIGLGNKKFTQSYVVACGYHDSDSMDTISVFIFGQKLDSNFF